MERAIEAMRPEPPRCPECATAHHRAEPHDAESRVYQLHFYRRHGRWPTWADAIAHTTGLVREAAVAALKAKGEVLEC